MKTISLSNIDIEPTLFESYYYARKITEPSMKIEFRTVDVYELELFVESAGGMYIDDVYYPVRAHDLVFRRPGQTVQSVIPFTCFCIRFSIKNQPGIVWNNEILDHIPSITPLKNPFELKHLFEEVLESYMNYNDYSDFVFKTNILQILKKLFELNHTPGLLSKKNIANTYIAQAVDYINHGWDKEITVNDVSNHVGLSKSYFLKLFADHTSDTPNNYIQKVKMKQAERLLVYSDMSVSEVAISCGIDNFSYFSTLFKKHTGLPPHQWRKQFRIID